MSLLSIKNLGKAYRTYRSEWLRFATWFNFPAKPSKEHWVIRGVSFDVQRGETLGIIGPNGAGKSTLLKMIAGIMQPTEGQVKVTGRIAAILELGMGFNPECTGRQNVYQAASLMGFSHKEITHFMPEIETFAEVGAYFDQPVRTYSTGMQVRVAFSVATAWRPEILIIDEALSVGDIYFQHKCFKRIREYQEQGTTLIIVSHDPSAIRCLCNRAILLEQGRIIKDGDPEEIMNFYNAIIAKDGNDTVMVNLLQNGQTQTVSGTGEVRIEEISIHNAEGEAVEFVSVGEPIEMRVSVKVYQKIQTLVMGYAIKDRLGEVMYGTNTWHTEQVIHDPQVGAEYAFVIFFPINLGVGSYSVSIALHDRDTHLMANYEWRDLAIVFNVVNQSRKQFVGCNWLEPNIMIKTL